MELCCPPWPCHGSWCLARCSGASECPAWHPRSPGNTGPPRASGKAFSWQPQTKLGLSRRHGCHTGWGGPGGAQLGPPGCFYWGKRQKMLPGPPQSCPTQAAAAHGIAPRPGQGYPACAKGMRVGKEGAGAHLPSAALPQRT